ncbi:MAG: type 1 glutamine amidotransferase domain-containing protein [Actinomycetota bacterium]
MHSHTEQPLRGRRAVVLVGPMFEDVEATYPLYRLREAGADVTIGGARAGEIVKGKKGEELRVDAAASDLTADEVDILVLPGGYGPDKLRANEDVLSLVREMHRQGKPIAFICHGGWIPASAGILPGRRATSYRSIADDLRNAGAIWEDAEVVVDGNLVSSRQPDDLPAFMRSLIEICVAGTLAGAAR